MMKGILLVATLVGALDASAGVIVDGTDYGEEYTLDSTAQTIDVTSGILTIGSNGNVSKALNIYGGTTYAAGGNISGVNVYGGLFEVDAVNNINLNGGITGSGGIIRILDANSINGPFNLLGDVRFYVYEGGVNANGSINMSENAIAYFDGSYSINGGVTNSVGKIVGPEPYPLSGSFSGGGSNMNYLISDSTAGLWVGTIPEPGTLAIMGLAGVGVIAIRRIFQMG